MNTAPHDVIYRLFCYFWLIFSEIPHLTICLPHKSLVWVIWGIPTLKRTVHGWWNKKKRGEWITSMSKKRMGSWRAAVRNTLAENSPSVNALYSRLKAQLPWRNSLHKEKIMQLNSERKWEKLNYQSTRKKRENIRNKRQKWIKTT